MAKLPRSALKIPATPAKVCGVKLLFFGFFGLFFGLRLAVLLFQLVNAVVKLFHGLLELFDCYV